MQTPGASGVPAALYSELVQQLVVHHGAVPHIEVISERTGCDAAVLT